MIKLKAWLELARVSNLPTVWSNVVMGLAWATSRHIPELGIDPAAVVMPPLGSLLNQGFMLLVAGTLIYTAGMLLNGVVDRRVDAQERPTRPIPRGAVCPHRATAVAVVLLVAGLAATAVFTSPWVMPLTGGLITSVVLYNLLHTRWPGAVLLMAACRGLLIFAVVMAVWSPGVAQLGPRLVPAAVLFAYTLLIAALARREVALGRVPLVIALIVAMPLIDAGLCLWAGHPGAAVFCAGCAVLTLLGQRFVKGS